MSGQEYNSWRVGLTPMDALARLQAVCAKSPDLLKGDYAYVDRTVVPLNGFCYILTEAMWRLFPGLFTPYRLGLEKIGDDGSHWFLKDRNSNIVETVVPEGKPTAFKLAEYGLARRKHRLITDGPSKRCVELIKRAGLELPN